ncbi:hypothetical protein ABZY45_27105 [Streptomyces sp. NPDC006516]|uniref:hypothetical protein n=1 Tax=Streptomyces sp. NPDC006516 TaxID=3154309 RepID=UPI0033AECC23
MASRQRRHGGDVLYGGESGGLGALAFVRHEESRRSAGRGHREHEAARHRRWGVDGSGQDAGAGGGHARQQRASLR